MPDLTGRTMTKSTHLWAVGFDDVGRAEELRNRIIKLSDAHRLILLDTAVAERYDDACMTLNGQPFVSALNFGGHSFASFLAGLALGAPPLTEAAISLHTAATCGTATEMGIDDAFVREVALLIKPRCSVLFVLDQTADQVGDLDAIFQGIRGLGGTVLKTNVDLQRVKLIQSALSASATDADNHGQ
jgi:uncharacterized membrane protein